MHRKIPDYLTPEEQAALLGQLWPTDCPSKLRNLAIIRTMLDTGLRSREAREIQVSQIDWRTGMLKVRGKGGRQRVIWLSDDLRILLKDWLQIKPPSSSLLFTSLDGRKPICERWLRKMVRNLGEKVGLKLHPHVFRHTFATDLLRKTKNLRLVMKALGHAKIETTTIYTHIVDDELEQAMKELRGTT